MKRKLWSAVFVVATLICSCGKKLENNSLDFPKTSWEMDMDEVLEALGEEKEDMELFKTDNSGSMFSLKERELFGEKTELINFQFYDFAGNGTQKFCYVQVNYPDDADMNHVLNEMKKVYGEPQNGVTFYEPYAIMGELREFQPKDPDKIKSWALDSVAGLIGEENLADYQKSWGAFQQGLNQDNWDAFIHNTRTVRVSWITDQKWNRLEFDAMGMNIYNAVKSSR